MELHYPVQTMIFLADKDHEGCLILCRFTSGKLAACQTFCEDFFDFFIGCRSIHYIIKTVVGNAAASLIEVFHAVYDRFFEISEALNGNAAHFGELCNVIQEGRLFDIGSLVRAPCRQYLHVEGLICLDLFVPFQRIYRIVGGAYECDAGAFDQLACAHIRLCQLFIAEVPYFFRGVCAEMSGVAEISLQLQMGPVIQRIADQLFQRLRPFLKFLARRSVAGDVIFLYAVGAHLTPLIMVAAKPHLSDVFEMLVLRDLLRIEVAVVVEDRHNLSVVVIQFLCGFCGKQKILVHKWFHCKTLLENIYMRSAKKRGKLPPARRTRWVLVN